MNNSIQKLPAVRLQLLNEIQGLFADGQLAVVRAEILCCRKVAFLRDLAAYIRIARRGGASSAVIGFNVVHDLFQWRDPSVLPRTRGYAEKERETPKKEIR